MENDPTRIYSDSAELEYDTTQAFFEKIAQNSSNTNKYIHGATMYQNDQTALLRNDYEAKLVQAKINFKEKNVLEVGCGTGRWAQNLALVIKSYLGIDFSPELIRLAKTLNIDSHCQFQVMPANDIEIDKLITPPPFDVIICSGICVYLNDSDLSQLITKLNTLLKISGMIYLREPISILANRMTLKNFYSAELKTFYNGVYRTDLEYKTLFTECENLQLIEESPLYDKTLHNRQETQHTYYILKKIS